MSDLDERLGRYARHLDEHMDRFEVRADPVPEVHHLDSTAVSRGGRGARPTSNQVWLATAAAICLLVAGSLVWWRSSSPGQVGVTDTTAVRPVPDAGDGGTVDDQNPDGSDAESPIRWEKTEDAAGGWSIPTAATSFKGGVLAVSGNAYFKPFSWWAPDGHTFEPQVEMADAGAPKALAADDSVAVVVGDGPGEARTWVTTDGRTWEMRPFPGADSVQAMARTPLGFVVVGSSRLAVDGSPLDEPHPAAWSSPDGRTWSRLAIPDSIPGEVTDVAASPDSVMLVGYVEGAPYAAVSDGPVDQWRPVPIDRVPELYIGGGPIGVTWSGDRFVAIGSYPGAPMYWELSDAGSFAPASTGRLSAYPASIVGLTDVADVDGTLAVVVDIAPGEHGMETDLWAAPDGGDWAPAAPIDAFPVPMRSISAGDGRFLAISLSGDLWVGEPTG